MKFSPLWEPERSPPRGIRSHSHNEGMWFFPSETRPAFPLSTFTSPDDKESLGELWEGWCCVQEIHKSRSFNGGKAAGKLKSQTDADMSHSHRECDGGSLTDHSSGIKKQGKKLLCVTRFLLSIYYSSDLLQYLKSAFDWRINSVTHLINECRTRKHLLKTQKWSRDDIKSDYSEKNNTRHRQNQKKKHNVDSVSSR